MDFETRILDSRLLNHPLVPSTAGSAGVDLRNCSGRGITLNPGEMVLVPTGLAVFINDPGLAGLVVIRSGVCLSGATLANGVGLIDSDYQGELKVMLQNRSNYPVDVFDFERIAQLVIVRVESFRPVIVDSFSQDTNRGGDGFGSTGRVRAQGGAPEPLKSSGGAPEPLKLSGGGVRAARDRLVYVEKT